MDPKKKVAFIVNPRAGLKKKIDVSELITDNFSEDIPYEIIIWNDKNNFGKIKEKLFNEGFTIAVAVGGDGTVNEVAKTVNHSNIALGIIPFGSGNGLARSLQIPLNAIDAIHRIETGTIKTIDSGLINGRPFFCTAGMGFDAHIGELFAQTTIRGLGGYIKIITKELLGYKPLEYTISLDGDSFIRKAFLISFANAGQYGNNFYIAPEANMEDGLLHIAVLKPFPWFMIPSLISKIFRKKISQSAYMEMYTAKELKVIRPKQGAVHFDGEPYNLEEEIHISIVPKSLKVIC